MAKVLLISNRRPDDAGGRAEKIDTRRRMLEERGWEVVVGHVPQPYLRSFLPSIYRCWRRARKDNVDVVHSISNPMHLQMIGLVVAFLTRLPWLAEFRDPMVKNPDREEGTMNMRLAKTVEGLTVRFADRVIWMDGIQMGKEYFTEAYPNVPENRFHELPFLGFESEKFESTSTESYDATTVTYAGSFYEGWIEPYGFLDGLERYVEKYGQEIRVQFYGDWSDEYQGYVEDRGLDDVVVTHDRVEHSKIVSVLKGSDLLLYLGGTDPQNRLSVPSKVWDYMGARRPMLAVVDPSFRMGDFVTQNRLGVVVHPDDADGIADAIHRAESGDLDYPPDDEVFERFSRSTKMDELSEVLDRLHGARK